MFAVLLHGGWATIILAVLFWLSPFIALLLVVNWVMRWRRKRRHSGSYRHVDKCNRDITTVIPAHRSFCTHYLGQTKGNPANTANARECSNVIGGATHQMPRIPFGVLLCSALLMAQPDSTHNAVIRLERTACYGTCPAYKVTIYGTGEVIYEGKAHVRVVGTRRAKIAPHTAEQLIKDCEDYLDFAEHNKIERPRRPDVSDGSDTLFTLTRNGRMVSLEEYVGAPEKRTTLEQGIDKVAQRWVYIDAPTVHEKARRGWNVRGKEASGLLVGAAGAGEADVVRAFIEEKADVNTRVYEDTPLQMARGVAVVKLLVSAGADVNAVSTTYAFDTPLTRAAHLGDKDSIEVLIRAGASVNKTNYASATPLMEAARAASPDAVRTLLATGCDVNSRDVSGRNAMWYAQQGIRDEETRARFAEPVAEPRLQYTSSYLEVIELLKAAGVEDKNPPTLP
jgi:hypothetical protein